MSAEALVTRSSNAHEYASGTDVMTDEYIVESLYNYCTHLGIDASSLDTNTFLNSAEFIQFKIGLLESSLATGMNEKEYEDLEKRIGLLTQRRTALLHWRGKNVSEFHAEASSRTHGALGGIFPGSSPAEKIERLGRLYRVAVPGLGGVGGDHCMALARHGISDISVADFDEYAEGNFNRQTGAAHSTLGRNKQHVMAEKILDVNPFARVRGFGKITADNIDAYLDGVDLVVDSMDFYEIETRILIFRKAREKGIPVITAAPIGYGASVMVYMPDAMTFEEHWGIRDDMSSLEKLLRFAISLAPGLLQQSYMSLGSIDPKRRTAASTPAGPLMAAGLALPLALKVLSGEPVPPAPHSFQVDAFVQQVNSSDPRSSFFPENLDPKWALFKSGRQLRYFIAELATKPVDELTSYERDMKNFLKRVKILK